MRQGCREAGEGRLGQGRGPRRGVVGSSSPLIDGGSPDKLPVACVNIRLQWVDILFFFLDFFFSFFFFRVGVIGLLDKSLYAPWRMLSVRDGRLYITGGNPHRWIILTRPCYLHRGLYSIDAF